MKIGDKLKKSREPRPEEWDALIIPHRYRFFDLCGLTVLRPKSLFFVLISISKRKRSEIVHHRLGRSSIRVDIVSGNHPGLNSEFWIGQ